ncbi:hypothetical protein TYRP_012026 [Tyrophagus putrescentiae]|nr:hypothetical protein TYRP_012026 [Tyrophagus putrescentiae]
MCEPPKANGLPIGAGGAIGLKAMGIIGGRGPGAPMATCEGNCCVAMPIGPNIGGMADIMLGPKGPIGPKGMPGGMPAMAGYPGGNPGMPGFIAFAVVDSSFLSSIVKAGGGDGHFSRGSFATTTAAVAVITEN